MRKSLCTLALICIFSIMVSAQFGAPMGGFIGPSIGSNRLPVRIRVTKGDTRMLQDKRIQTHISLDKMEVVEYGNESKFIDAMVKHYNDKKPGKGDLWAAEWDTTRHIRIPWEFYYKFNGMAEGTRTHVQYDSAGATIRLYITTHSLEIGYDAWITREPATINVTCDFRDLNGKSVAEVEMDNIPGEAFGTGDFDVCERVAHCYQKLAKELFKVINKGKKAKAEDE